MRYLSILLLIGVTLKVNGQQINPVPDYIFRNSMSVGRNAPTDTSAYFSIGPRFGATRGFMPPMVVDTAAVTGTKRNGLLIYSIQRNSFLYWDSTGSRWSRIAANLDTLQLSTRAWRQKGIDSLASVRVGGSGTINRHPKFTASGTIGDGSIADSSTSVRMTILSGGNIGVATAAPAYNLDVAGSLRNTTNAFFNTSSGESYFGTTTDNGDFRVQVSGNQYVSGNVGIGASSVASGFKLGVQDAINISGTNPYLNFNTNSGIFTAKAYIQYQESGKQLSIASSDTSTSTIVFQTGNPATTKMTITGNGNVGIGKTPSYKLDVDGVIFTGQVYATSLGIDPTTNNTTTNGTMYSLNQASTTNSYGIGIGAARNSVFDIWFKTGTNGGGYRWYINLTEQMTLTNTGNLGIGTTAASEKLHVVGNIKTTGDIDIGGNNVISSSGRTFVNMGTSGTTRWYSSGAGTGIQFYPNNVLGMFIDDDNELMIAPPSSSVDSGDYKIQVFGNTFTDGSITTSSPSSGSKKPWKLGEAATVSPTSPNRTIRVEIDGVVYYIHAKTTND